MAVKSILLINTMIESVCIIAFRESMKRPTINGKIKNLPEKSAKITQVVEVIRNIAVSGSYNKDKRYDIGDNSQTL